MQKITNYFRWISVMAAVIIMVGATHFTSITTQAAGYSDWSSIFDPVYYSANNPEANAYAGGNADMLWDYFLKAGMAKGDQASAEFNVVIYAQNYPDLLQAFGNNLSQYYVHYATIGKAEGRNAATAINGQNPGQVVTPYNGEYGSAGYLRGKTLLVSLFPKEGAGRWTSNDAEDMVKMLQRVNIATDYIVAQVARYGRNVSFEWDWRAHSDLAYFIDYFPQKYTDQAKLIEKAVNESALKAKYGAENVVYIVYLNTDASNTKRNCTYSAKVGNNVTKEVVVLGKNTTYKTGQTFLIPSSAAHEILHAFGAPDLYSSSEIIPQSYVNYLKQIDRKDIMRSTNFGDTIQASITDITAYYLGLIPSFGEVQQFGLGKAEK